MQDTHKHKQYTHRCKTHKHTWYIYGDKTRTNIYTQSNKHSTPLHNTQHLHTRHKANANPHTSTYLHHADTNVTPKTEIQTYIKPIFVYIAIISYIYLTAGDVLRRNWAWDDAADLLPSAVTLLLTPMLWQVRLCSSLFRFVKFCGGGKLRSPRDLGLA